MLKRIINVTCLALLLCGLAAAQDFTGSWQGFMRVGKYPANYAFDWNKKNWNFTGTDWLIEMDVADGSDHNNITGNYRLIVARNWRQFSQFEFSGSYKPAFTKLQWSKGKLIKTTVAGVCKSNITTMVYSEDDEYEHLKGIWVNCDGKTTSPIVMRRKKSAKPEPPPELEYFEQAGVRVKFPKSWTNKTDNEKHVISSLAPDSSVLFFLKQTDETVFDEVNKDLVKILQEAYPATYTDLQEGPAEHDIERGGLGLRVVTYTAKEDGAPVNITVQFAKPPGDDSKVTLLVIVGTDEGGQKFAPTIIEVIDSLGLAAN